MFLSESNLKIIPINISTKKTVQGILTKSEQPKKHSYYQYQV